ncbi:MAG: YggS family pyridoxal phosphate enzyme [Acidobacteria bacterium SCN 69-37]|nr:MAG: YggS family pyridoxal phosphate enzyme [Acidobacteria bacterium SCN 69-37]
MPPLADIRTNLDSVRRRLQAAAHRAHRAPTDITLVAVSKTFGPDLIRAAAAEGQRIFGENRVQEALAKRDALEDLPLEWHLIGHLQSNKARKAVTHFTCIHSVDRLDLLTRLDAAAAEAGVTPRILIQVDLAGEATKHGADRAVLDDLVAAAAGAAHVRLSGLMLIPPNPDTPDASRPWFRRLRDLRDELVAARTAPADCLRDLSMGMSHDFEVAIEEGATIVRVGTSIFGSRPAPA